MDQAGTTMKSEYELLLPFDTDNAEFARGVEVGILWQRLETEPSVTTAIKDKNAEMVMRIAEARGLTFRAEPLAEGWLTVTVGEAS
jgi:hypothetical protein